MVFLKLDVGQSPEIPEYMMYTRSSSKPRTGVMAQWMKEEVVSALAQAEQERL